MHQLALSYRVIPLLLATVSLFTGAIAAPLIVPRQSITVLSAGQISTYTPYTWFSSTGYCSPATTLAWDCGGMFCIDVLRKSDVLMICKQTAMQILASTPLLQAEMGIISNIGL
jgi:hypothetical protein